MILMWKIRKTVLKIFWKFTMERVIGIHYWKQFVEELALEQRYQLETICTYISVQMKMWQGKDLNWGGKFTKVLNQKV